LISGKLFRFLVAVGISVLFLFIPQRVLAWPTAPDVTDGVISSDEYGSHTDGENQQTNGGQIWYLTWNDDNLYIGITGSNVTEGAVIYIDANPLALINGGTNANGSLVGQPYDGTNFAALQFRADFVTYFKNSYREYRNADGIGGWSGATTSFGTYGDDSVNVREIAIPWSAITGSGRPASFAWFGYLTSSSGSVYGTVPTENSGGNISTSAHYSRYYIVSNMEDGASTFPFSRNSYVFNRTADINDFGTINVYDFTMNAVGHTITRTAGVGGDWTIAGNLHLAAGTIDFGSSATMADISGDVLIGSGGTLVLSSAIGGDLQVGGDFTQDGTFAPNSRTVFFDGMSVVSSNTSTDVDFDYIVINNDATLQVSDNIIVNAIQNVTNNGTLSGTGYFNFSGPTFTNNGVASIYELVFHRTGTQSIAGTGTWVGDNLWIASSAEVSLANDITFEVGETRNEGTVSGSHTWSTSGTVAFAQDGTFTAPFEVQSGTTVAATGDSSYFDGLITIASGAELQVFDNEFLQVRGDVVVNGEIANASPTNGLGNFDFYGPTFTNNGVVSIYIFAFHRTGTQSIAGAGTWVGDYLWIASSAEVSLANDITFEVGETRNEGTVSGSHTWGMSGMVGFAQDGTFTAPFEVQSGTTVAATGSSSYFDGLITVASGAELQVLDNEFLRVRGDVVVNGEIANASPTNGLGNFDFYGPTFTNNGVVSIYIFAFHRSGTQSVAGTGAWTGDSLWIASSAEVSLANDITFETDYIEIEGTISGENTFGTSGVVEITQLGTFNAPFEVQSGRISMAWSRLLRVQSYLSMITMSLK